MPLRWNAPDALFASVAALALVAPLAPPAWGDGLVALASSLATLALVLAAWDARGRGERLRFPLAARGIGIAAVFMAVQLLPLPPRLFASLSPYAGEIASLSLEPLGRFPAWRPLSLDPGATARELAKALCLLATLLATLQAVRRGQGRRLITLLGLSAFGLALVGLGHKALGLSELWGVIPFREARPPLVTPFGNPNHLASFLALGGAILLSRCLETPDRRSSVRWGGAFAIVALALFLTGSRGGIAAGACGAALILAFSWRRRWRRAVPLAMAALGAAGLAWLLSTPETLREVFQLDLGDSKIALWGPTWELLSRVWGVGIGRGAFASVFPRFQPAGFSGAATFPENVLFQLGCELGIPCAVAVIGAIGWNAVSALRRSESGAERWDRIALGTALLAISLHELVDFGLERLALAIPVTIALGALLAGAERSFRAPRVVSKPPLATPRAVSTLLPLTGLVGLGALALAGPSLADDSDRLETLSGTEAVAAAIRASDRRPADWYPHLIRAQALLDLGNPREAARAAATAMEFAPTMPSPHLVAARALFALGHRAQALSEYRRADALRNLSGETFDLSIAREVARLPLDTDEFASAVRETPLGEETLAWALLEQRRFEAAREVAPGAEPGLRAQVDALRAQGKPREALALLGGPPGAEMPPHARALLAARLALEANDTDAAKTWLASLSPSTLAPRERAEALRLEAGLAEGEGRPHRALQLQRTAAALASDDPWSQLAFARALERAGLFDEAARAASNAARLEPSLAPETERLRNRARP